MSEDEIGAGPDKLPRPPRDMCFVIMPFGGFSDQYYTTIYKPAIIEASLEPRRADDIYRPGTVINDIWMLTRRARVILADLTGRNPNVFYELGLAHAIAKPAVVVTSSIDEVPFDLRGLRVLEYNKDLPDWGQKLRSDIARSLVELRDSPLSSVLPAFVETENDRPGASVDDREHNLLEIRNTLESLRREVAGRGVEGRHIEPTREDLDAYVNLRLGQRWSEEQVIEEFKKRGYSDLVVAGAIKRSKDFIPF